MDKHSQRSINNRIKYFGANLWWWRWYFVSFRYIVEVRSIIRFYSFHFIHSAFDCPHVRMHTNISQSYGCLCSCSYFFWAIANSVFSTRTNRFPANKKKLFRSLLLPQICLNFSWKRSLLYTTRFAFCCCFCDSNLLALVLNFIFYSFDFWNMLNIVQEIKSKSLHGYSFRSSWIWCLDHEHFGGDFFPFVRCFIRLEPPMEFQYRMQFKRCVDRLSGVYKFGCVNFTITEVQISWFMNKKKK